MRKFIIILLGLIVISEALYGQSENRYDLLSEPYILRPLALHKGVLQINGSYNQLNSNSLFDSEGNKESYVEAVKTMIENRYNLNLSYGILEHLEFGANMAYRSRYLTYPSIVLGNWDKLGYESTTFHTVGFTNLNLVLKYQLPSFVSGFNICVNAGVIFPISSQAPRVPEHTLQRFNTTDPNSSYVLDYNFRPAAGNPSSFLISGLTFQYATQKIGVFWDINAMVPFKETETYLWSYRAYDESFEYSKNYYNIREKGLIASDIHFIAQPFPWFAVTAGYKFQKETPGWNDASGQAISLERSSSGFAKLGAEIQVSTHFRIAQEINLQLHGRNSYSKFSVEIVAIYSLFPIHSK
jgi:hypothetical protein